LVWRYIWHLLFIKQLFKLARFETKKLSYL